MLCFNQLRTKVKIDLDVGIYQFFSYSATGKTYLYNVLRDYQLYGSPVATITYDPLNYTKLTDMIKSDTKLIMLDRYDMYYGEYADVLERLADKCIILIDSKEPLEFGEYALYCDINITPNEIEVSE